MWEEKWCVVLTLTWGGTVAHQQALSLSGFKCWVQLLSNVVNRLCLSGYGWGETTEQNAHHWFLRESLPRQGKFNAWLRSLWGNRYLSLLCTHMVSEIGIFVWVSAFTWGNPKPKSTTTSVLFPLYVCFSGLLVHLQQNFILSSTILYSVYSIEFMEIRIQYLSPRHCTNMFHQRTSVTIFCVKASLMFLLCDNSSKILILKLVYMQVCSHHSVAGEGGLAFRGPVFSRRVQPLRVQTLPWQLQPTHLVNTWP